MKKQDLWSITLLKYFSQILFQYYFLLEETIIEIVEKSRSQKFILRFLMIS